MSAPFQALGLFPVVAAVPFIPSRAAGWGGPSSSDEEGGNRSEFSLADRSPDLAGPFSRRSLGSCAVRFAHRSPLIASPGSSSGGGSSSAGGPGSVGGGGGGRGPKKPKAAVTDKAIEVVLLQLKIGGERQISLTRDELEYLMHEGLIELMRGDDYSRHDKSLLRISLLEEDLNAARDDRQRIIRDRSELLKKSESVWHRLLAGRKKLDEEAEDLRRSAKRIGEISDDIKRIEEELKQLDLTKEYLGSFVRTPYGYMRLSRKGEQRLKQMRESEPVGRG